MSVVTVEPSPLMDALLVFPRHDPSSLPRLFNQRIRSLDVPLVWVLLGALSFQRDPSENTAQPSPQEIQKWRCADAWHAKHCATDTMLGAVCSSVRFSVTDHTAVRLCVCVCFCLSGSLLCRFLLFTGTHTTTMSALYSLLVAVLHGEEFVIKDTRHSRL